jgi:PAS domain S-box-containing protein
LLDEAGTLRGFAKIMRDRTDLKQAEESQRESEAQLRLVTDHAPVFLAHCDRERRFKFANRPYTERFRLTPEDVVGKHVGEVLGQEAYEAIRPYVDRALAGEEVEYEIEVPYRRMGRRHMHCAYTGGWPWSRTSPTVK